jgi:uncharacterized protein
LNEILTWDGFGDAAGELAQQVADSGFAPTVLLAIARGGLPVAGAIGYALGLKRCLVINVEYYVGIDERLDAPVLLAPALDATHLADQRVLVVDDVADTGETLRLVIDTVRPAVAELRTLAIYHKPRSVVRPDYVWRHTDRWIEFPWSSLPVVRPRGG